MNYEIIKKKNKLVIHFSEESMMKDISLNNENMIILKGDLYDIIYDILVDADIVFNIKQYEGKESYRKITIISDANISLIGRTLTIEYFRYTSSNHD